ncbi:hypothetical protein REPUB_Repub07fG0049900 [Reevesia pubescens]
MIAEAIVDIPAIPRINELGSVNARRQSTGKVIMPNGGLTVFSRYLRTSQGSCHDLCKYGTSFTLETESKSPRSPAPKIVTPKGGACRTLERTESNLGERRKKSEVGLKLPPDFKIQEPDDPVVVKIAQTQGGHHVENDETNATGRKKAEISLKPSGDTKPHKPDYSAVSLKPSPDDLVYIKTIAAEGEAQDEENATTKLSKGEKKPEVGLKHSPDSKSQTPFGPDCIEIEESSWIHKEFVSPKQMLLPLRKTDVDVVHARDSNLKPQSKPSSLLRQKCSSGKKNIEGSNSMERNILSITSLGVSSGKNKGEMISQRIRTSVMGDKKNVVLPSISLFLKESGTSVSIMNAKKKKSRGVFRSKKQENAMEIKLEKSCGKNAKGSKNQKGVSHLMDQENVKKPNSEQDSFEDIPEKTLYIIESNSGKKPAEYIQNSVHANDFSTMQSSSSKDKSMKHARNRIPIGQSPRSYEKKNVIYRSKGIHARGLPPSLSPFSGKKGLRSTPHGLNVTQPSLTSLSSLTLSKSPHGDAPAERGKVAAQKQKSTSKMMYNGRAKMALITTSKDKHLRGERLNFQRGKVIEVPHEDSTPRRLAFKQRVLIDNSNDDNRKNKVEDCTPKRLKFRRRVLVDNRNGDNQNGKGEEFTQSKLKFRRRVLVDNRNAVDNQTDRDQDCTPRKLKFKERVLDDNKTGYIQNAEGDTSKKNSKGKEADVGQANATEVHSDKISLKHNDVEKKKDSGSLYNNMIEETARRLVRTKTTKVKALVSAFESVISHLDTKVKFKGDMEKQTSGEVAVTFK